MGGKAKEAANKAIISDLGGRAIDDITEEFAIYVTEGKLVRNCKLLKALASNAAVVGLNWLRDSKKQGAFIRDNEKYWVIDREFEK